MSTKLPKDLAERDSYQPAEPIVGSGEQLTAGALPRGPRLAVIRITSYLILTTCAFMLAAQESPCEHNFHASGSLLKGKTLETWTEYTGVDVATAIRRLQAQLPAEEIRVLRADTEGGVIEAQSLPSGKQRVIPIAFTVVPATNGGVRVKMVMSMPAGMFASSETKPGMCRVLGLVTREPAAPSATSPRLAGSAAPLPPQAPAEPALTNETVVQLVEAGLGDEVVVAKIKQAPVEQLDVSANALIALKKKGVSKAVVTTMIARVNARNAPATSAHATTGGPASAPQRSAVTPVSEADRRSKHLSRPLAAEIIQKMLDESPSRSVDLTRDEIDAGIRKGYWTSANTLLGQQLRFTRTGAQLFPSFGSQGMGSITLNLRQPVTGRVVEVTGITEAAGGSEADAEFTWKYSFDALPGEAQEIFTRRPNSKATASFKLYDDGWRWVGGHPR